MTRLDQKLVKEFDYAEICTKEIWCKKVQEQNFKIIDIY